MVEFPRKFFTKDKVFGKLHQLIKQNHRVAEHTRRVLFKNKDVKDFCEEARHFVELPGKNPIYIHYDVASWFKAPNGVQIRVESIGIYDDFLEYETARMKQLHSGKKSDIPNIN